MDINQDNPVSNSTIQEAKHSIFGIVSFAIALLVMMGVCCTFGLMLYSAKQPPSSIHKTFTDVELLLFLLIFFSCLVGIAMGIAGITQHHRRKEFAVIGMILNFIVVVSLVGFFVFVIKRYGSHNSSMIDFAVYNYIRAMIQF